MSGGHDEGGGPVCEMLRGSQSYCGQEASVPGEAVVQVPDLSS